MRIEVDPEALIAAGRQTGALGGQLARLSDALGSALSGGIASGMDPAGLNFGLKYGHQAGAFASAVADAANAFSSVGQLLEVTGHNYRNADAASTIGGPGPAGWLGGDPSTTLPAHVPAGPNGTIVPPPSKWYLVQPLLQALPGLGVIADAALTWPSGNSAMMGVTAMQWRNFGTGFALIEPQLAVIKAVVAAQQIPEGPAMRAALDNLGTAISSLADVSSTVAQSISDFAGGVRDTQDAIRRLLDRLSLEGLWDTVTGFLTGEGDDILREVARDVGTVLHNFQQQVKGIVGLLDELTVFIGDAATAFQKWIRPVLVEHFGAGLGNTLADAVTFYTDVQVGAVNGLIGTVSGVVAMADPDTWIGMAQTALSVATDPSTAPGVLANTFKEFVAWDEWSGDHPGRGVGEAAFNIGSLFVPGGPLSKTGSVAKGLNLSRRMLEEGRLPRVSELGSWIRRTPNAIEAPDVPGFTPAVPGAAPPVRTEGVPPAGPAATPGVPPERTGEPARAPGRPSTQGAEGSAGPRAPVEQPSRPAPAEASPRPVAGPLDGDGADAGGPSSDQNARIYSLTDGSAHATSFAPEQLLDNRHVSEALEAHDVGRTEFVDLVNTPTEALTPEERHLINAVRDAFPAPTTDSVMQKVIPPAFFDADGDFVPSRADDYLTARGIDPEQVRGSVTVADDTAHLSTPSEIYDGLRLDYPGSSFDRSDAGTHIIRFQADPESLGGYEVPRNSVMGGSGDYDGWTDPFTGNGFTKSGTDVIPEYVAGNITMREGAEMWEVLDDGSQRLAAVLRDGEWIPQGNT